MLTATDLRTSQTAKIKKLFYYTAAHWRTTMCSDIVIGLITFIFAVFDVRRSVAVNMCINCSFFYINTHRDVTSYLQLPVPDPPPYDADELSSGSVLFLFAVPMCGIVSILRFVISTVIQFSDVHSSHIYLAALFPHNCYPIYSLTL